jgi:hypothetical protein
MTAAEWMLIIAIITFTFSIGAELFNALRIRHLLLFNKCCVTLPHLARNYFKLWHWVWVIEETAICMCAHHTSAKQSCAISTKQMSGAIFFCTNNHVVIL